MKTLKTNPEFSKAAHHLLPSKKPAKALVSAATACSPELNLHRNLGIALLTMGAAMASSSPAQAATQTWTSGNGVNVSGTANWSNVANWTTAVPASGDSVTFGATTGTTALNYDLALSGLGTVTFNADAPAYTISGNAIVGNASYAGIVGFVVNSASSVTQTINLNFTAYNNAIPVTGSGNLTLTGAINKGGTYNPYLEMDGTGVLTLGGSTTMNSAGGTNPLQANSGTVILAKTVAGAFNLGLTINGGTVKLGAAEQLRGGQAPTLNAGTLDLNGYDSALGGGGTGVYNVTYGIGELTGLGGRVTNNAAGSGTNWLVIDQVGTQASYGGTITDGTSAKVGLSVMANYNQSAFHAFSGINNYSGGTFIQNLYTGSGGRAEILSISNVASIGSTGNRTLTFKSGASSADTSLQLTGTAVINSTQFDAITFTPGLGAAFDIADPNNTFTFGNNASGASVSSTGLAVFEKLGAGTMVVTGSLGYTNATYLGGGTLKIDAQNGGILPSASAPLFAGGSLYLLGKTSGSTTQTLGNVSMSALSSYGANSGGASTITVDANGGAGTTLTLGTWNNSTSAGYTLNVKTLTSGTVTTTTTSVTNGLLGNGRVTFTDASGNVNFAGLGTAVGANYPIQAATYTANLPGTFTVATGTTNYSQANNASITTSGTVNALKLTTSTTGQALTISGGQTLTLTTGGLLFAGGTDYSITGGALASNTATNSDLIIHQYGAGTLTIGSVIANGVGASTLTKAGPGSLVLNGANTYTGQTYVTSGTLSISSESNIGGYNGTFLALTSTTNGPTVTSTAASLPTGFGVGSTMLGRTVNSYTLASGTYTITLSGNANTALTGGTASWVSAVPNLGLYSGGVLQANGTFSLAESNTNGGAGTTTVNRNVTIGNSGGGFDVTTGNTLTVPGTISAAGMMTKSGAGTLVLGAGNYLTGGLTINDGTVNQNATNALTNNNSSTATSNLIFGNGSAPKLQLNAFNAAVTSLVSSNANAIVENGGGTAATLTVSNGADNIFAGKLQNGSTGTLALAKSGGGKLTLNNAGNTFTGGITIYNGILEGTQTGALGTGTITLANGTLKASGSFGNAIASLAAYSGAATAAVSYFNNTIDTSGLNTTLSGVLSGTGALNKTGTCTLTLTNAANTYAGAATVSAGTLALGAGAALGNTAITAGSGAVFATGTGAKAGSTGAGTLGATLTLTNGTLDLSSDSVAGTFNLNQQASFAGNALTLNNSTLKLNIVGSGVDLLAVTGTAAVVGVNTVTVVPVGAPTSGTYNVITAAAGLNSGGSFVLSSASVGFSNFTLNSTAAAEQLIVAANPTPSAAYWSGATGLNTWTAGSIATGTSNWVSAASGGSDTLQIPAATTDVFLTGNGISTPVSTTLGTDFPIKSLTATAAATGLVTVGGANTLTIGSGGITLANGSGGLAITTGNLVLNGAQTWTNNSSAALTVSSPVVVSNTLSVAGAGPIAANFTLNTGAVLASAPDGGGNAFGVVSSGLISGTVTAGSGAHTIAPGGVGVAGHLGIGSLTTNSNTTLNFDLTAPQAAGDDELIITGAGATNIGASTAITFGTSTGSGTYRLINYSGATPSFGNLTLPSAPAGRSYTLTVGQDVNWIDLRVNTSGTANSGVSGNWSNSAIWANTAIPNANADTALYNSTTASGTTTLDMNATLGQLMVSGTVYKFAVASDGAHSLTFSRLSGAGGNAIGTLHPAITSNGVGAGNQNTIRVDPNITIGPGETLDLGDYNSWTSGTTVATTGTITGINANVAINASNGNGIVAGGVLNNTGAVKVGLSNAASIASIGGNVTSLTSSVGLYLAINADSGGWSGPTTVANGDVILNGAGVTLGKSDVTVGGYGTSRASLVANRAGAAFPQTSTLANSVTLQGSPYYNWDNALSTYNGGGLSIFGSTTNKTTDNITNALTIGAGFNNVFLFNNNVVLNAGSLARSGRGTVDFLGNNLGTAVADSSHDNVTFTASPASQLVGGGGAWNSQTASILPWANVNGDLATYGPNGMVAANTYYTGPIASATTTANCSVSVGSVLGSNQTINALKLNNGAVVYGFAGARSLTITSGAILATGSATLQDGPLIFGSAEGVVQMGGAATNLTIDDNIVGSNGLTVSFGGTYLGAAASNAVLTLSAANNNSAANSNLTGPITVNFATLNLGVDGALKGVNASAGNLALYGGVLSMGTHSDTVGGVTLDQGSIITGSNGATLTSTGGYTMLSGSVAANLAGSVGLNKSGPGTVWLSGTNTYTGTTTISGGELSLMSGAGATLGTNLTFAGSGAFNLDNSNSTGAVSGSLGTLTFTGGDSTVQTTRYATQNVALTLGSLAARSAGATGRFILGRWFTGDANGWNAASVGTTGTNSKISITGQATGFIDPGIYFATNNNQANWLSSASSSDFAWYDANGYVRGINYGVDANTANFGAGTAITGFTNWYINLSGNMVAQTSGTFNTLRFGGAYSLNLAQNATLTLAKGGLLVAGNNGYATIAGGAGIQAGSNTELIIRTDATTDGLRLDTPILANGSNALTKSGAGILILNAANTFTGDTVVNDGTVIISNPLALQYSTLNYNNQGFNTLGAVSNQAATTQLGAYNQPGLVTFTGNSATFGGLKGGQNLQFAGVALTVGGNGQSTTYSGVLSGAGGSLTKTGTGTLILGAANTYTGATTVTGGALSMGGVQGTSGVTLAAGTSLIESSPLTLNALTLGSTSGDVLTLKLNSVTGAAPITVTSPNALLATGTTTFDLSGASFSVGTVTLLKYAGTALSSLSNFAYTGVQGHVLGSLVNDTANTSIDLQLTQDPVKWTGNTSATWDINNTQNWKLASSSAAAVYLQSGLPDMAVFDDSAAGNFNVTVSTTVQPASLTVNNSAINYTFSGGGKISGTTGLAKSGTGTLTLTTAGNDYTGGTTVTGGALVLGASGALPTGGALTVNSASVDLGGNSTSVGAFSGSSATITTNVAPATFTATSGAAAIFNGSLQDGTGGGVLTFVKSGTGTLTLTGSSNYSGGTTVTGGTLQLGDGATTNGSITGNITDSASVAFANPAALAYSGAISGTGSVVKSGAGTLTLTGTSNYSGGTTISAGTLQLGDGTSNGSLTGNIVNNGALTFAGLATSGTFAGLISGSGSFTKGAGYTNLTLSATNTFNGLTVNSGTLSFAAASGNVVNGTTTLNNGVLNFTGAALTLNALAVNTSGTLSVPSGVATVPTLTGSGALSVTGASAYFQGLTLTGTTDAGFSGTINVANSAYLSLANEVALGSNANALTINGNLYTPGGTLTLANHRVTTSTGFTAGGTITFTGGITGAGGPIIRGNIVIGGSNNDYAGATSLYTDGGTWTYLTLGSDNALPYGPGKGNLNFTIWNVASGRLDLAGHNLTVNGLTSDIHSTGGAFIDNVSAGGTPTLTVGSNNANGTYTGVILNTSGTISLIKTGTGTQTLSGSNSYTGSTTISAGTLQIGAGTDAGSVNSTSAIIDNGALVYNVGSGNRTLGVVVSGSGSLTQQGTGTVTLSGSNGYSGRTTINAGTLLSSAPASLLSSSAISVNNAGSTLAVNFGGPSDYAMSDVNALLAKTTFGSTSAALGLNLTVSSTYSGVLSMPAGLTLLGGNSLRITGSNSYTGPTNVNGTFLIAASSGTANVLAAFGTGPLILANSSIQLKADGSGSGQTIAMGNNVTVSGNTSIDVNDLTANSNNTYAMGTLAIGAGQLNVSGNSGYALSFGATTLSGTVTFNDSANLILGAVGQSGSSSLIKTGAGTLTFTGGNTYSGATTISGGVLQLGNGTTSNGTVAGNITNNASLVFAGPATTGTYAGVISGTGTVTKNAAYTSLTLTGANSFSGLTVNSGTLNLSGVSGNAISGTTTLNSANLYYTGGSVTLGALAVNASGTLTVPSARVTTGALMGSGALTVSGSSWATGLTLTGTTNAGFSGTLTIGPSLGNYSFLDLTNEAALGSNVDALTLNGVTFNTAGSAPLTIASHRIHLASGGGIFYPDGGDLTLSGGITGPGAPWIRTSGSGAVVIGGTNNDYTGNTNIWADGSANATLRLGANNALPYGPGKGIPAFNATSSGTAQIDLGGYNLTVNALNYWVSSQAVIDNISAGGTPTLTVGAGDATGYTFGGLILNTSGTVALVKIGTGIQTLSGSNSYSGGTTISSGTLRLGNANALGTGALTMNGGTLDLAGISINAAGFSGSGTVRSTVSGTSTLTATIAAGASTYSGSIVSGVGAVALTKTGAGALILSGSSTFTGPTAINAGTLQLGDGGTGGSLSASSAIANNAALVFNRSNTLTQGTDFGTISGSGAVTQAGAGTTVLSASNSYSGGTIVSGGTLQVGNANALGTGDLAANGGTLDLHGNSLAVGVLSGSAGALITNTVSGTSSLTTAAAGTSTYSGDIVNGAGAVVLTNSGAGTLILGGSLTMAGLNAQAGGTQLTQSATIDAVNVAAGATLSMAAHSGSTYNVLNTSALTISGFSSALGMGRNAVIEDVSYASVDAASQSPNAGVLTAKGTALAQQTTAATGDVATASSPEAVPEPGVWGLMMGASALLGFRRSRKNRS